jgi:hypothetical protein
MPIVTVDSRDRNYIAHPSAGSYVVTLPDVYKEVVCVKLLNVELPTSFYLFSTALKNTSIRIAIYDSQQVKTVRDITIPDGNYSTTTMKSALETALNDAFNPITTFTVSVVSSSMKLSIKSNAGYDVEVDTSVFCDVSKTTDWGLGYNLGFRQSDVVRASTIVASTPVMLQPYTYLLLDIVQFGNIDECGPLQQRAVAFAKVPITKNTFEYVFLDRTNTSFGEYIPNPVLAKLDRLTIRWRFHDGTPVDFNGLEHSFSIEVQVTPVR